MRFPVLLLTVLFSSGAVAQQEELTPPEWPPGTWKNTSVMKLHNRGSVHEYRIFQGWMVLKNKDTLSGYICSTFTGFDILEKNKFNPAFFKDRDIDYVRGELPSFGNNFVEFKNINGVLYRLIKEKGTAAIYDHQTEADLGRYGPAMLLFSKNKTQKIYADIGPFGRWKHPGKMVLRFINRRYKKSFHKGDFKSVMDMIDYILNSETAVHEEAFK